MGMQSRRIDRKGVATIAEDGATMAKEDATAVTGQIFHGEKEHMQKSTRY